MKTPLFFGLILGFANVAPMGAQTPLESTPTLSELAARLDAAERRLALMDRKFKLLSVESEQELNGVSAVFSDPKLLKAQALKAAGSEKSPERAYQYLSALHTLYPGSVEDRETFPLAAELFRALYFRMRYIEPDGIWATSEPIFMFQWLSGFFPEDGTVFPQAEVERLMLGMPVGFLALYENFVATRPRMAKWKLETTRDNGLIEALSAALQPTHP